MNFKSILFCLTFILVTSCSIDKRPKEVVLYETYCASCHLAPDIKSLPKNIWEENVLPAMAARMGIINNQNHPYFNLPFNEQTAIIKTGIFPSTPLLKEEEWEVLKNYIISMAPDSLPEKRTITSEPLQQFKVRPVALDSAYGSLYTFLSINGENGTILNGTRKGELNSYDLKSGKNNLVGYFNRVITDATLKGDTAYVTTMGRLEPSEVPVGKTIRKIGRETALLADSLHRPVHTLYADLDSNGTDEIIISEFGDLTGKLTLYEMDQYGFYQGRPLMNLPGSIKAVPSDMNNDGKTDLVVMAAQGDEAVYILYQEDNLNFRIEKVIRFSPVYGSSWFELVDYDGDGHKDIITVNGNNADESYVHKPYHGMRIHINDGNNNFKETYFHPLNGATKIIAKDFDQDGDLDMALLATFLDYERHPEYNFVFLENVASENYTFKQEHLTDIKSARWFLMDAADIDGDGDDDLVLSALTYSFTPVPKELEKAWSESYMDLLILENKLN